MCQRRLAFGVVACKVLLPPSRLPFGVLERGRSQSQRAALVVHTLHLLECRPVPRLEGFDAIEDERRKRLAEGEGRDEDAWAVDYLLNQQSCALHVMSQRRYKRSASAPSP